MKNSSSAQITVGPQVPLPLVDDEFKLGEFVKSDIENGFFLAGILDKEKKKKLTLELENGISTIVYEDTLSSEIGETLFNVPDQEINFLIPTPASNGVLPNGQQMSIPDRTEHYQINTPTSEELDSIILKAGVITLRVTSNIPAPTSFTLSLPSIKNADGSILQHTFALNTSTETYTLDLKGAHIDLTQQGVTFNRLTYSGRGTITGQGQAIDSTSISCQVKLNNLMFKMLYGKFDPQPGKAMQGAINIDIFDLDNLKENRNGFVNFDNASIVLSVGNSFGIPVSLVTEKVSVIDLTQGRSTPMTGSAVEKPTNSNLIKYPKLNQVGEEANSTILLDTTNSNIKDLFSIFPYELNYRFQVGMGGLNVRGFVSDSSRLTTHIKLRIPLQGSINNLTLTQNYSLDEIWEGLKKAIIKVETINSIPIDVRIQIYFRDDDFNVIDSLFSHGENTADAAPVDDRGFSNGVTKFSKETLVDRDKVERIKNLDIMTFSATLKTDTNSATKGLVKIIPENMFKVKATSHLYVEYTVN